MSEIELRELDVWICENVFLWELKQHSWRDNPECDGLYWTLKDQTTSGRPEADADFSPTTDPSANRELFIKLITEKLIRIDCYYTGTKSEPGHFHWQCSTGKDFLDEGAETPELALCLLAKKIYSQNL